MQKQENVEKNDKITEDPNGGIPAYTIGHPLCGPDSKVCYLDFKDAYSSDGTGTERSSKK